MPQVEVLRLGHRPGRDKRLSTHVALTARAFGADRVVLTRSDPRVRSTVDDVCDRFGGDVDVAFDEAWRDRIRGWQGRSVHLTMYGAPVGEAAEDLAGEDLLVVVGAEKVPADVYDLVDVNVAVGNQPHSEVAALAVLLDRVVGVEAAGEDLDGPVRIEPSARGKRVVTEDNHGQSGQP